MTKAESIGAFPVFHERSYHVVIPEQLYDRQDFFCVNLVTSQSLNYWNILCMYVATLVHDELFASTKRRTIEEGT